MIILGFAELNRCWAISKSYKRKRMIATLCICSMPLNTMLSCWVIVYQKITARYISHFVNSTEPFYYISVARLASASSLGMIFLAG